MTYNDHNKTQQSKYTIKARTNNNNNDIRNKNNNNTKNNNNSNNSNSNIKPFQIQVFKNQKGPGGQICPACYLATGVFFCMVHVLNAEGQNLNVEPSMLQTTALKTF